MPNAKLILSTLLLANSFTARFAHADFEEVQATSFAQLCPDWIGGDREYDGHGPRVNTRISLANHDGQIVLHAEMHQIERTPDWSEARLTQDFVLAQRVDGKRYTHMWAPRFDGVWEWGVIADAPFFDAWQESYFDTSHGWRTVSNPKYWLQSVITNGDTPAMTSATARRMTRSCRFSPRGCSSLPNSA